jgi:YD repeat-containing protein
MFFLSGKVVIDDGSALAEGATLQMDCKGQRRTVAHTDTRGQFSFQLGGASQFQSYEMPDATDTAGSGLGSARTRSTEMDYRSCQLQALAPGFTSEQVELASRLNGDSYVDVGRIVLHRMAQVQGFMISATSAAAPPKAKKNFEKGLSLEKKSKWPAAQQKFQAAVNLYPKYAQAWLELGRMQLNLDRKSEAEASLQKALAADPKFLPPYQGLIEIAAKDKNWKDLADRTEEVLKLDPVSFPGYWFFNSAANYNQQKYDLALKSALRGVETDVQHRIPRLQYLLGLTLAQKHDYKGAVEHMLNYLRTSPAGDDALVAQTQLKRLQQLESGTGRE